MRLLIAMALALLVVSCSSGNRDEDSSTRRKHRETSSDEAPTSKPPLPEIVEALREYLRNKGDHPNYLPVVTPTQSRTIPPGYITERADPSPVLPFLWEDPAFWDEIYMRSARDGSGLPDGQSRRRRRLR